MPRILPTVVAIDDSAAALSIYALSTSELAVDFCAFQSADAAIAYFQTNQPDLVFLDIVMPEKDGLTLLKELRTAPLHEQTPVIVVTSKDYAQDRVIARELGALEFVLKPLRPRDIRELIRRYTGAEARTSD